MDITFNELAHFSQKTPKICGVKITTYAHHIFKLLDMDYKVIYMIRDPRDVILSAKNRFVGFNPIRVIRKWEEAFNFLEKFSEHPNFVLIKYESFISKKEKTIEKLEKEIGLTLNFNVETLQLRNKIEYIDNSSFSKLKVFDQSALYRWKKHLNDKDVLLANSILKKKLEYYNYDSINSPIPIFHKLKYHISVFIFETLSYLKKSFLK